MGLGLGYQARQKFAIISTVLWLMDPACFRCIVLFVIAIIRISPLAVTARPCVIKCVFCDQRYEGGSRLLVHRSRMHYIGVPNSDSQTILTTEERLLERHMTERDYVYSSFLEARFSASSIAALSVCGFAAAGAAGSVTDNNEKRERRTTEEAAGLEWSLKVAFCWLAQDVDRNGLGVIQVLEAHECLHE